MKKQVKKNNAISNKSNEMNSKSNDYALVVNFDIHLVIKINKK